MKIPRDAVEALKDSRPPKWPCLIRLRPAEPVSDIMASKQRPFGFHPIGGLEPGGFVVKEG